MNRYSPLIAEHLHVHEPRTNATCGTIHSKVESREGNICLWSNTHALAPAHTHTHKLHHRFQNKFAVAEILLQGEIKMKTQTHSLTHALTQTPHTSVSLTRTKSSALCRIFSQIKCFRFWAMLLQQSILVVIMDGTPPGEPDDHAT